MGDKITEGTTVNATGKSSFAQFKFKDGSLVLLREGKLELSQIENRKNSTLSLLKGTLFIFKTPETKELDERLIIKTKNVSMGIRGTKFFVQEDEAKTYVCVCHGVVAVSNETGTVELTKKQDIFANKNEKLKQTNASKDMWKAGVEGFKEMGVPLL